MKHLTSARHAALAAVTFLVLHVAAQAQSGEAAALDPELPYQAARSNPVTYETDFSIVVTPPYKTKRLQVWLPIPPSDLAQEVTESQLSSFPTKVEPDVASEPEFGNRFAYFEFKEPQGAQVIRHRFRIKTWELRWQLDPEKVTPVSEWPDAFNRYRRGESQAVVVDDRFDRLLAEIVPERRAPFSDFDKVLTWVNANFEYDHHDASLRADATHGLTKRHGHCSDYHSFCAAMGRVLGYPTRVTYGINPFPKNSPSHCKLEAFIPPYGWVSFDVSETQRLARAIRKESALTSAEKDRLVSAAQRRLREGFRDNTWFLQTRGTDYELVPKASRRVPVVRTAWIEADGRPLPEPDPADPDQQGLSWMTVHEYVPDQAVTYPFSNWKSLEAKR